MELGQEDVKRVLCDRLDLDWSASSIAPWLSVEKLRHIEVLMGFAGIHAPLPAHVKGRVLLSFLCVKKPVSPELLERMQAVVAVACGLSEQWVITAVQTLSVVMPEVTADIVTPEAAKARVTSQCESILEAAYRKVVPAWRSMHSGSRLQWDPAFLPAEYQLLAPSLLPSVPAPNMPHFRPTGVLPASVSARAGATGPVGPRIAVQKRPAPVEAQQQGAAKVSRPSDAAPVAEAAPAEMIAPAAAPLPSESLPPSPARATQALPPSTTPAPAPVPAATPAAPEGEVKIPAYVTDSNLITAEERELIVRFIRKDPTLTNPGSEPTLRVVLSRTPEGEGKEKEVYILLEFETKKFKIAAKGTGLPMIVEVRTGEGTSEWVILELQGTIEGREKMALNSLTLGTLDFVGKTPHLVIGNQKVSGSMLDLPKPLAVLRKCVETGEDGVPVVSYTVQGFVKKKLLFKSRPQPIVAPGALQSAVAKRKR